MATINDKIYTVVVSIPYEGIAEFEIFANKETALEDAVKQAKQMSLKGGEFIVDDEPDSPFRLTYTVWYFERDQHPDCYITVSERIIH